MADLYESVKYKRTTIKIYNRVPACVTLPTTVKTGYKEVSKRDIKKSLKNYRTV